MYRLICSPSLLFTMHSGKRNVLCPSESERAVEDNDWMGERKGECIMAQHVYCGTCCIPFTYEGFQKKNLLPMGDESETRWASIKELLLPRFCKFFFFFFFFYIQDKHFYG